MEQEKEEGGKGGQKGKELARGLKRKGGVYKG